MKLEPQIEAYLSARLPGYTPYREGFKAQCLWHDEKTPSMFVYFDTKHDLGWWMKCQGCGESGSINKLLKRVGAHHLLVTETRKIKVVRDKVEVYRFDFTKSLPRHYWYFRQRGITDAVSERFGFCFDYSVPGGVMPLYCDHIYRGFIRRNLDPREPRYHISRGVDISESMWGFDAAHESNSKTIFITEGIIDAACLWSAGYAAIALLGKNWEAKVDLLRNLVYAQPDRLLVCVPDNDTVGLRNFKALAKRLPARLYTLPTQFKDVSDWATAAPSDFYRTIKKTLGLSRPEHHPYKDKESLRVTSFKHS